MGFLVMVSHTILQLFPPLLLMWHINISLFSVFTEEILNIDEVFFCFKCKGLCATWKPAFPFFSHMLLYTEVKWLFFLSDKHDQKAWDPINQARSLLSCHLPFAVQVRKKYHIVFHGNVDAAGRTQWKSNGNIMKKYNTCRSCSGAKCQSSQLALTLVGCGNYSSAE